MVYSSLQLREIFHLEFLRWFCRKIKTGHFALKGGANLRFFFKSNRYSEDMDIDIQKIRVEALKKVVMEILESPSFQESFITFGITQIIPPDIRRAKQTETTQRFKVHLITGSGEDLFTKIEFSRRGIKGKVVVQSVSTPILRVYKVSPLLIPHYAVQAAIIQKIDAIVTRSIIQPRDIFDLYVLIPQYNPDDTEGMKINRAKLNLAYDNVFEVEFKQFRDTVIPYLPPDDQSFYNSATSWDEIKFRVANFIEEL